MRRWLLLVLLVTIPAFAGQRSADPDVAYKDGWMDAMIDVLAISNYHICADNLKDDEDEQELAQCWKQAVERAKTEEAHWYRMTDEEKRLFPGATFWNSGKGEPRRFR